MDTKEVVLKILNDAGEPLKTKDIAEKAGIDSKEVNQAIKSLKTDGKIISPKRCYYSVEK
ncbi:MULTISPECIES: winged helix-turn-helix transcriptional regulator [Clostridium]|uniref:winged helix-turn-helix transcriptional regulator n=1 Tax=Clostridium TaxID=1485 RepID=UPI000826A952|nr:MULTISPECIES: HTH domain-containing protein [Clostridium]PJI09775.1 HTH domain-containing protein [Clostridium sp. CT7]